MSLAVIRFSQSSLMGDPGHSVLGLTRDADVHMVDMGGPIATFQWEFLSWPSPLTVPPTLLGSDTQTARAVGPFVDGIYIVRLTRTDSMGTSKDIKFFGIADEDGLSLPSAGMTRAMSNVGGVSSQNFGWAGSSIGTSNFLLDAYLRKRRQREGRYSGGVQYTYHDETTQHELFLTYGINAAIQYLDVQGGSTPLNIHLQPNNIEIGATFRFFGKIEVLAQPVHIFYQGVEVATFAPTSKLEAFLTYVGDALIPDGSPVLQGWYAYGGSGIEGITADVPLTVSLTGKTAHLSINPESLLPPVGGLSKNLRSTGTAWVAADTYEEVLFQSSTLYEVPWWANTIQIDCCGGGGGGGGGGMTLQSGKMYGGGGGGAGSFVRQTYDVRYLRTFSSPLVLNIIVGAGGIGGLGATKVPVVSDASSGSTGGFSRVTLSPVGNSFALAFALGGGGGNEGSSAYISRGLGGVGGTGGLYTMYLIPSTGRTISSKDYSYFGGTTNTYNTSYLLHGDHVPLGITPTGGGGGGGIVEIISAGQSLGRIYAGGTAPGVYVNQTPVFNYGGGTIWGVLVSNPLDGATYPYSQGLFLQGGGGDASQRGALPGIGGGGGRSSSETGERGGDGGAGTIRGGGGGGGGAAFDTVTSGVRAGNGGNGGNGYVRIILW